MTPKTITHKNFTITPGDTPSGQLGGAPSRGRSARAYRIAARLELAAPSAWCICVEAGNGRVWLEPASDSADDRGARLAALEAAFAAEAVS